MSKSTVRIRFTLPRSLARDLRIAVALRGSGSVNDFFQSLSRQIVAEERRRYPAAFDRLSPAERTVYEAIKNGCFEYPEILGETGLSEAEVEPAIGRLLKLGIVVESTQARKNTRSHGAKVTLYVPKEAAG